MFEAAALSIGAINALVPVIVILILIAAAAGLTRGSEIFRLFGVSTLLGIRTGRGTLSGKSPFKAKARVAGGGGAGVLGGLLVKGAKDYYKSRKAKAKTFSATDSTNSTSTSSNASATKVAGILAPPSGDNMGKGGPRGDGYSTDNRYRRRRPSGSAGRSYSSENTGNEGKSGYSGASPSSSPSPYSILGVAPGSTPAEIKAAWKKLAVKYNTGRYTASELEANPALKEQVAELNRKFIKAKEAYETLRDKLDIK